MTEYLEHLKRAIHSAYGCDALHVETVPVIERFDGKVVWEGEVEVFDLMGQSRRCYSWAYEESGQRHITMVLHELPVQSPRDAVRASVASQVRR